MEFTGERYIPSVTGEIYYEHVHRYAIAAPACAGKRVLDLASGEGWGAALLARHAADVVGIDIDAASIEHARRAYYLANLRFVTGSATEIPLPDASIDVITSFETIEHLTDHDRMLDEFRRVLVPNGTLFLSSPNKLVYSDLPNYQNPFHVRELYYHELRDLLKRRFANVDIYGQRFVSSSILHPLSGMQSDAAGWYAGDLSAIGDGLPTFNAPVYFVAVCSDGPLYDRVASGFVDPHDDLYTHLRQELEVLRYRVSAVAALPAGEHDTLALVAAPQEQAAAPDLSAVDAEALEQADAQPQPAEQRYAELVTTHETALTAERELRAELEAEVVALRERCAVTADAEARCAEQSQAREGAENEIVRLRSELASATQSRDGLAADLRAEIERARRLESQLAELTPTVEALRGREAELAGIIAERDALLAARDVRHTELKRALGDRDAEIVRRDAIIAERSTLVAEYDAIVRLRDAVLVERDARIVELEQAAVDSATRIAALQTMVGERDAMEARIVQLQGRLAQNEGALAELRERSERDAAALREIMGSRSWRMTAFVRRAAALVRTGRAT